MAARDTQTEEQQTGPSVETRLHDSSNALQHTPTSYNSIFLMQIESSKT